MQQGLQAACSMPVSLSVLPMCRGSLWAAVMGITEALEPHSATMKETAGGPLPACPRRCQTSGRHTSRSSAPCKCAPRAPGHASPRSATAEGRATFLRKGRLVEVQQLGLMGLCAWEA